MRLLLLCTLLLLNIQVHAVQAKSEATTCMYKALEQFQNNNFPEAMKLFTRSVELADSLGDEHAWLVSIGYISNVYFNAGDYGRCFYYQCKGYEVAKKHKDLYIQKNYLSNMVAACSKGGRVELAKKYIKLLQKLVDEKNDDNSRYYLLYDYARIYTAERRYDDAIKKHLETLDYAKEKKMNENLILFQYYEIGNLYLLKGDYAQAIEYGRKCLKPKVGKGDRDFITSVYKLLADAYMMSGNNELGDYYNDEYFVMQDSVFNRSRLYSAGNALMEYENRKTDKQINTLNGTISRQSITLVVFSGLLLTLVIVLILLFRNNRRLDYAYRALIRKGIEMGKQEMQTKKLLEESIQKNPVNESAPDEIPVEDSKKENTDDAKPDGNEKEQGIGGIVMSEKNKMRLLNSIIEVMNDTKYISNPDFSLNALAEAVDSNTRYVSWVINDSYGKNFKTLLNECRIKEACRCMLDTEHYGNVTMQAIYEEVGYTNNVSFIRAFKKVNGMTPSEYQRQYHKERSSQDNED